MIAVAAAWAGDLDTSARSHTAETVKAGEWLVRAPIGRTMVGVSDRVSLFVAPFDLGIGGPRVGAEWGTARGGVHASLSPSVGVKTTLRRGSLRLEAALSADVGVHQLTARASVDGRWLRPLEIDDGGLDRPVTFDRVQTDLVGVWDTRWTRAEVRLPLLDQGRTLSWGTGAVQWTHTGRRAYVAAGIGLMVGRPYDQYTLGAYQWWFWQPYPKVDLAVRL